MTPGAAGGVIVQSPHSSARFEHFSGRLGFGLSTRVSPQTAYDLASLTKVLSTTLLCAVAVNLGKLSLDETPWPDWPSVSVAHILSHAGGLPAWLPLYQEAAKRGVLGTPAGYKLLVETAKHVKPIAAPGKNTLYSDLGFLVLGALLEERLKDRLEALFDDASNRYFGPTSLTYMPLDDRVRYPKLQNIAPTELSPWLGVALHGQVHDPNAYAMGGVAGHAGLFGTLEDVCQAATFFLGSLRNSKLGVPAILRDFARYLGPRALGFDKPTRGGATGEALSAKSVGHLGFTGTSLWLDPNATEAVGAAYVLLTNRVHIKQGSSTILELRRQFHRTGAKWVKALTQRP